MRTIKVTTVHDNKAITHTPKGEIHIGEAIKFVFTDKDQELNTVVEKWGGKRTCKDCALNQRGGVGACVMCPSGSGNRLLCAQESGDIIFLPLDQLMEGI